MSSTPRVRSGAFPQTPRTAAPKAPPTPSPSPPPSKQSTQSSRSPLPMAPQSSSRSRGAADSSPRIPLTTAPAPTQRLIVFAFYMILWVYKLYDWVLLVEDDAGSLGLCIKWVCIDSAFLFILPELRIPWLELSPVAKSVLLFLHAWFDFMLMLNIGLPWQHWILGFLKVFYDREIAISEHSVKRSQIVHNSSLIMGRQIINILPEGSATLNVERKPFCLGPNQRVASIPIHFNATVPKEVEIIRKDLETNEEEVLKLTRSQLREIGRLSNRHASEGAASVVQWEYPVKKPGAYRLGKVLDEYKLEVQKRSGHTFVVPCPEARFRQTSSSARCLGDLSDLSLRVAGTPPLQIHYSRTINGKDHSFHFQSLQPDEFASPLVGGSMVVLDEKDVSWARAQEVSVGLNESMHIGGDWEYSVDEVHDAFGNIVKFLSPNEDPDMKPKPKHLTQNFLVKERPRAKLQGCDLRNPLKVAKGQSKELPVSFEISGHPDDTAHDLVWQFSPIDSLTKNGDHGDMVSTGSYHAKNARDHPKISAPGLYTLKSVTSGSCEGEVQEPSSCLLLNPMEPQLTLRSEDIPDVCAGNSVGLRVDLDLTGTPPFIVRYNLISNNSPARHMKVEVPGMRYQLDLTPDVAGQHKYIFQQIDDAVYKGQPLRGSEYVLEQAVKPAASARIFSDKKISACLEEEVDVDITLLGEPPFSLEWEIIHEGKRKTQKATGIEESTFKIRTDPLARGGEYTIALTSVQDRRNCRNFLQDETKVSVRRQRPRAWFGQLENKRATKVIESAKVSLPVRLTGEGPWKVFYRNVDVPEKVLETTLRNDNDILHVNQKGEFEIVDVYDKQCHGVVDPNASKFTVDWIARPELSLVPTESITEERGHYVKNDVCEGDIDGFETGLKGSPPYHVEYEVRHKPTHGSSSMSRKEFDAALSKASIQMETSKSGLYTYKFSALADNLYDNDKRFQPLVLEQRVNARPGAAFVKPGQTFKICSSDTDAQDKIPIILTGAAPFYVEIEIKHHQSSTSETYRIPSIDSNSYGIQIPRQHLKLGTQSVRIRKVRDARGCEQHLDSSAPSVQVQVFDAPSIYELDKRTDYCVGERISYTLSGTPPFEVWYTFDGAERKAKSGTTSFRRLAESAGEFVITGVSDKASECRASVDIAKTIHPLPAARISRGDIVRTDIHEGGEVEILFEFYGSPPFEFTYTRSSNAKKGQKSQVLETRHDKSFEHSMVVRASQEGTYEVVAIKDRYCSFSTVQTGDGGDRKMLTY
ncbi:hypothetical protein GE09DRAFT_1144369 [Coniochaeta sp. 2T2.1]|nr:hypothetical protein GE09DRAFT_1144369 [Coniochaeta sp. 2T2.1]